MGKSGKHHRQKDINKAIFNNENYSDLRSCAMKKAYKSEKGARLAIELNPKEAGCRYYHCDNCKDWHTTKVPLQTYEDNQKFKIIK